jgi:hypothetical protein
MKRTLFVLLFVASSVFAQNESDTFLLRNVSGTTPAQGSELPHLVSGTGTWRFFTSANAHLTYVNEVGPDEPRNEIFSTNWITAGVHGGAGDRLTFLARGRVSLEPYTMPGDDGYPQVLQYVPFEAGGPLIDVMRPQDLVRELGAQAALRLGTSSYLHVYGALVGDPAFGAAPFELRSSGVDFAAAPFGYAMQELTHDSTSVVTAGFTTSFFSLEGSVFHDAVTFGEHTDIDDGDIDSRSARLTITPSRNLAVQVSRAELGEGLGEREMSSASVSWSSDRSAVTALWSRRELAAGGDSAQAYGIEAAFRGGRNTFLLRLESVDRPAGFPSPAPSIGYERTSHGTVGYIFDIINSPALRTGVGVNIDYHTQSHELPASYGHKPQSIYTFLRVRMQ